MQHTKIEWALNPDGTPGYTWNPITGCLNGCEYCYARKLANTRLKERYLANHNVAPSQCGTINPSANEINDPFYPRFWPERLGQIPLFGKSLGIFACDMSDLFGIGVPRQWTARVLNHIGECQRHRFYLLTKQPQNLIKFSPFPENCWVGITVTHWEFLPEALYNLSHIEASVRFISFEPLLEFIPIDGLNLVKHKINWVIIGAQTKPTVYPKIEWVKEIVGACDKAGVPVFLKDNLKPLLRNSEGWTPAWAISARSCDSTEYLRQEMPK